MKKAFVSLLCLLLIVASVSSCAGQPAVSSTSSATTSSATTSSASAPKPAAASSGTSAATSSVSSIQNQSLKNVVILATGGTIAGTGAAGKTTEYKAGELNVQALIDSVPGIDKLANISGEQILNTASDNVTGQDWLCLAKRINELATNDKIDGFVVTHGTDTLEETAYFLTLTVKTKKPVVVVGAMRPSTATSADGPFNLYQAVALARSDEAIGQGAMVIFSDGIYSGRDVQKINTFKTDAFGGKDFGCLGYMRDDKPYFYTKTTKKHTTESRFDISKLEKLPKVSIAYFHIDADPDILDYFSKNSEGIVTAGAGNGSYSTLWSNKLVSLEKSGVPVVNTSRISNGIVTISANAPANCIGGDTLNPQKARILLSLALTQTKNVTEIKEIFKQY